MPGKTHPRQMAISVKTLMTKISSYYLKTLRAGPTNRATAITVKATTKVKLQSATHPPQPQPSTPPPRKPTSSPALLSQLNFRSSINPKQQHHGALKPSYATSKPPFKLKTPTPSTNWVGMSTRA
ncbi:ubiquitin-conjugating enzyme E2 Q2 [Histoplasma capsulatum var. duboisii H88]|uniref:Ubiquitin-conjugating enzyme E2 Q2 n=1 Tax=Ajellomyces capsulatus (strain H88) TaxID=544711 RepID=A0A8A1LST6_AJEC8|nr:ubiquitin-conjugating enzyme E2 Q2 [Histoplasma capsulatum var. duboisii H88]